MIDGRVRDLEDICSALYCGLHYSYNANSARECMNITLNLKYDVLIGGPSALFLSIQRVIDSLRYAVIHFLFRCRFEGRGLLDGKELDTEFDAFMAENAVLFNITFSTKELTATRR